MAAFKMRQSKPSRQTEKRHCVSLASVWKIRHVKRRTMKNNKSYSNSLGEVSKFLKVFRSLAIPLSYTFPLSYSRYFLLHEFISVFTPRLGSFFVRQFSLSLRARSSTIFGRFSNLSFIFSSVQAFWRCFAFLHPYYFFQLRLFISTPPHFHRVWVFLCGLPSQLFHGGLIQKFYYFRIFNFSTFGVLCLILLSISPRLCFIIRLSYKIYF